MRDYRRTHQAIGSGSAMRGAQPRRRQTRGQLAEAGGSFGAEGADVVRTKSQNIGCRRLLSRCQAIALHVIVAGGGGRLPSVAQKLANHSKSRTSVKREIISSNMHSLESRTAEVSRIIYGTGQNGRVARERRALVTRTDCSQTPSRRADNAVVNANTLVFGATELPINAIAGRGAPVWRFSRAAAHDEKGARPETESVACRLYEVNAWHQKPAACRA